MRNPSPTSAPCALDRRSAPERARSGDAEVRHKSRKRTHIIGAALLFVPLSVGTAGWIGVVPSGLAGTLSPALLALAIMGIALLVDGRRLADAWRAERRRQARVRSARHHRR